MKPNLFIVGAPKSGTTSLYSWLSQHPNVFFPVHKEVHYFSHDLKESKRFIKDIDTYLKQYQSISNESQVLGDASVFYLYSSVAIPEILSFNPEAKFIIMLRNPFEMITSLHTQYLYTGNEVIRNFDEAWENRDKRVSGYKTRSYTEDPQLLNYEMVCRIGTQLNRALSTIPPDQVRVIFLDDLKENAQSILSDVLSFLKLSSFEFDLTIKNRATVRKSSFIHHLIKSLNQMRKNLSIPNLNTGFGKIVSDLNTSNLSDFNDSIKKTTRKELSEIFIPEVEMIERLTKRDLTHWKSNLTKK